MNRPKFMSAVVLILLLSVMTHAAPSISLQGKIIKPDNSPQEHASTAFTLEVHSPGAENCILYSETQTADMTASTGLFSLKLNSAASTRTDGNAYSFTRVFSNYGSFSINGASCAAGSGTIIYTPGLYDERKVYVRFQDPSMGVAEAMPIATLTHSSYAFEAEQISGFPAASLCRVEDGSGPQNVTALTPANFTDLVDLINGASAKYVKASAGGGAGLPLYASTPASPVQGNIWYDTTTNNIRYHDGTSVQTVGYVAGLISSVNAGTGLTGGGSSGAVTISLDNTTVTAASYGGASNVATFTVDAQGRLTAAANAAISIGDSNITDLAASKVGSLTASRAVASDASGKLTASGTTSTELGYLSGLANTSGGVVYGNGTTIATTAVGTSGQILKSAGAGAPTWANEGWEFLGSATCASNCTTTGAVAVAARKQLMIVVTITGYTGNDIGSLRFNGDNGTNYWDRHLTSAAGGTGWTNAQNTSTTLMRLAGGNSTRARSVQVFCTNNTDVTAKSCTMQTQTSTGNANTAGTMDMGGGEWYSGASTQINSIELLNAGTRLFFSGSGMVIFGRDF